MLRKPRPQPVKKASDPRAALVHGLARSGEAVASACGTCGAVVRSDDPEAVQTTRQTGKYPNHRTIRSWRYHRVCSFANSGPELLTFVLAPDERPIRVSQAHYDVCRSIGAPLAYQELEASASTDRGHRTPWKHVDRDEINELRAAVAKRHRELTEPVRHSSGYPCGVCGRSHELVDRWTGYRDRPVCGECARMIERSKIPGNRRLSEYALSAAFNAIPDDRDLSRFGLARDMPSYRPLASDERREPWAYVVDDLPRARLDPEERIAMLEKRLSEVAA